jgi:toxin-antitoxin system PIN domain toxin
VAAVFPHHPAHRLAGAELEAAAVDNPACFCRITQQGFLRLITTHSLLRHYGVEGFTNRDAWTAYSLLRRHPAVVERDEPAGTMDIWHQLAVRETASPKVWTDAYLAAFALAGNLDFATLDRDFESYTAHGLRLRLLT